MFRTQKMKYVICAACAVGFGAILVSIIFRINPRRIDLPGRYSGSPWGGAETLFINPDGTFLQTFKSNANVDFTVKGQWHTSGSDITFSPFLSLDDDGKFDPHEVDNCSIAWDLERNHLYFGEDRNDYVAK